MRWNIALTCQTPVSTDDSACMFVGFDLIVMAPSLGGLDAYSRVLGGLPPQLPAGIVAVQHRDPRHGRLTADLLARWSGLAVSSAALGERPARGTVQIASPEGQLVIAPDGQLALASPDISEGLPQRCTADGLFTSAAAVHTHRVIAVVLSGKLADGADGVRAIKARGGRVLVQDPATALAPDMPLAAIATGCVDFVLPPERIAIALTAFVMAPGAAELFRVPAAPWALLA